MSEEEKEALENVKHMVEDISLEELIKNKDINVTIYSSGIIDILRVIIMVERQQKEINKLKDKIIEKINWYKDALKYDCNGLEDEYKHILEVLQELL